MKKLCAILMAVLLTATFCSCRKVNADRSRQFLLRNALLLSIILNSVLHSIASKKSKVNFTLKEHHNSKEMSSIFYI